MGKSSKDLIEQAKGRIENLDVEQVAEERDAGAVIVDLREAEELQAQGRIPGAIHVPRGMLEFRADPDSPYHLEGLDPSKRVILHCAGGARSALAAATLKDMGYEKAAHLEGGFGAWKDAGKPTEQA